MSQIVNYGPNTTWRYYAERITTGEWLDRDLQLDEVSITWAISGPGSLTAKVNGALAKAVAADGRYILDEWSTAIYAEADGEIRWGGILRRSESEEDGRRTIEVVGFCGYPKGRTWDRDDTWYEVDPFHIVREVWNFVQSDPNGDIGMTVDNTISPITIGGVDPGPRPVKGANETQADYEDRLFDWQAANPEGGFRLSWYEAPDCGDTIDNVMQQAPADYVEHHYWTDSSKESVTHRLELGYPMIGRRRLDLRFAEGENITIPPLPDREGDEYSNHVMALGTGEGRHMIIGRAGTIDGRLRRDKVVQAKAIYSPESLRKIAEAEMQRFLDMTFLDEITVHNHPNARIGSWTVGDEIFIQSYSAFEQINTWYRIIAWTIQPENNDMAVLEIVRA